MISVGMTSSVFASWWNPTTWKIFSRKSNPVVQNVAIATTTESTLLSCNGSKYNKCPEGQNFICPTNGEDAYCEKGKSDEVKTPKIKDAPVLTPSTKTVKLETAQKPKTETKAEVKETTIDKNTNNAPVVTNTNSPIPSNDSVYDVNNIMDKDGNAIVITQDPNYKFTRIVTATRGGIKGFFYKDKNTFFTEKELDDQTKASQDASDREFGRGIYAPTTPSAPVYDANKAVQEKQAKLDAVNLEIANLNAKYAENVKNVTCIVTSFCINQKSSLQSQYIENYNLLQAKFQQIKYSN